MNSRYAEIPPDEEGDDEVPKQRKLTLQEKAIFLEGDALQIEMGNIVMKTGTGGTIRREAISTRIDILPYLWQYDLSQNWKMNESEGCSAPRAVLLVS